jgi:hypothetical protein
LILKDIYNLLASLRNEELDGKTPVEWLLAKLKEQNYSLKEYVNLKTNCLKSLFFAHLNAVAIYKQYLNIILIDCTYRTNWFRMPLLNIRAVTGNKKTIQIALCFLSSKKIESYK